MPLNAKPHFNQQYNARNDTLYKFYLSIRTMLVSCNVANVSANTSSSVACKIIIKYDCNENTQIDVFCPVWPVRTCTFVEETI